MGVHEINREIVSKLRTEPCGIPHLKGKWKKMTSSKLRFMHAYRLGAGSKQRGKG